MAAFLTTEQADLLDGLIEYLENSPTDRPVDESTVDRLAKLHTVLGFDGEMDMREKLRDQPVLSLIRAIAYLNDTV